MTKQPARDNALASLSEPERHALKCLTLAGTVPGIRTLVKLIRLGLVVKKDQSFLPVDGINGWGHPSISPPADTLVPADWPIVDGAEEEEQLG